MFERIKEDIKMAKIQDPASKNSAEIFFCYPGLHAIWIHLISHKLWKHNMFFISRIISHLNRFFTGIEIHPAVKIGRRVFIDYGMGVVIGETAIINDDVLIYQGVVLGGTSLSTEKRHPTIGSGAVIGAGAIVIGNINVGKNAKVGACAVVLNDVSDEATVVGVPGRVVHENREYRLDHEHQNLPDPVNETLKLIIKKQEKLESEINSLKNN
ncbi:MAG: serine O-acetyltransferase [Methanobacteriaceae archaeon]|jgi:serine O-acetyltransferase|nr:serine O-acetyltransferase [Methanobacteriaceae archaeon]